MREQQVAVFRIGQEEYAIAKAAARAAVRYPRTTKLPGAPDYLEDVISVRGQIIPVISLYAKFGLPHDRTKDRWVLVVDNGHRKIGLLVDEITDILSLAIAEVEPTPGICNERGSCVKGIGKSGDRLIVLLDPAQLFTKNELAATWCQISGL